MVSKTLKGMLVAATAGVMTMMAANVMAQAPAGGPPGGPPRGMGMGMGMPMDRAGVIQRFGLADEALKLSAAQKAEIDKIADAYLVEQKALNEKYPMAQGAPNPERMQAMQTARGNLNAAVGKVLNDEQRKTWEASQASRRGGPGGFGGPGGGRPPGGV